MRIIALALPYCFHRNSVWKQARRSQGKRKSLQWLSGAPEEIRTPDPQIRSLVLYPAELRARCVARLGGRCAMRLATRAIAIDSGTRWQAPGPAWIGLGLAVYADFSRECGCHGG